MDLVEDIAVDYLTEMIGQAVAAAQAKAPGGGAVRAMAGGLKVGPGSMCMFVCVCRCLLHRCARGIAWLMSSREAHIHRCYACDRCKKQSA